MPKVRPVKVAPEFKDRLYLLNNAADLAGKAAHMVWNNPMGGAMEWNFYPMNAIIDTKGEVRWYMHVEPIYDVEQMYRSGVMMGFQQDEDGNITDEAWTAAEEKAQEVLTEWQSGDADEESFGELANTYSTDTGSNSTGGLYEDVHPGQMITEFNDWCFDPARQTGDTGIIHNESTGYHVMYFVGYDQPYWEIQESADLVNDAVDTFYEEKTEGYTAEQSSFGMSFVG